MAKREGRKEAAASEDSSPNWCAVTFRVEDELHERFLNAVDALSGPPERLRYVSVLRSALEREVDRLEKKHNASKPFPARH